MDFDNAKENIQPLASGRNVSLLQASLSQDSGQAQELLAQRKQWEEEVRSYKGDDPLDPWYSYICWIEQSYPAGGSGSGLQAALYQCLTKFEKDERYRQDRRFIKLFIKFMEKEKDQIQCYQQMYNDGIGTMLADFYIAWAYSYDLTGNMRKADEIFRLGIDCRAEPLEDLREAHQHFGFTVAQRMFYTDGEEVSAVTQELNERRLALQSLHGRKKRSSSTITVGSVRTGAAVKSGMPGVVQVDAPSTSRMRNASRNVEVYNDENVDANALPPVSEVETKSTLRSIIDAARGQENVKEPVAWNMAHSNTHKSGKMFAGNVSPDLGFDIHVDEQSLPPITKYERRLEKPFRFPPNFVSKNVPQEAWVTPVTIEDEPNATGVPSYQKCFLYPRPNLEFSPEEYCAYIYLRRRDRKHPFVIRNDEYWGSGPVLRGVRCYPNFAKTSKPQPRDELDQYWKPPQAPGLQTVFDKLYHDEDKMEYQPEELLAKKWQQKRNTTVHGELDMEETVCLPGNKMPRRKSFFPTIKKSTALPNMSDVMEEEAQECDDPAAELKPAQTTLVSPPVAKLTSEKSVAPPDDNFVVPAPPTQKIEIYEDAEEQKPSAKPTTSGPFFEADETCSTQMFNMFLKNQAVSTPKCSQKLAPVRQFGTVLKEISPADDGALAASVESPLETHSPKLRKELSTILETSEHGTQSSATSNATTKSTIPSTLSSPGSQGAVTLVTKCEEYTPGPIRLQRPAAPELSTVNEQDVPTGGNFSRRELWEPNAPSVPMLKSLRFQEDKTETIPRPLSCFQEDKTETLPRLPSALPEISIHQPMAPPPQLPSLDDESDLCGFFGKTPPKMKLFGSPMLQVPAKRTCDQATPDIFSKSIRNSKDQSAKIAGLTDSFKADLSFIPETQPMTVPTPNVGVMQKKFEIFLDETQPEIPDTKDLSLPLNCTLPETQVSVRKSPCLELSLRMEAEAIGPSHITSSFIKDCIELSTCPPPPVSTSTFSSKCSKFSDQSMSGSREELKAKRDSGSGNIDNFFELNAATEMFATNISMIKNSTLLPPPPTTEAKESLSSPKDEMSIYYKTPPLTPKQSHHSWPRPIMETQQNDNFVHPQGSMDSTTLNETISDTNVNPFNVDLIASLLKSIDFYMYIEELPHCQLVGHVKKLQPNTQIELHAERFEVSKMIGKGAYGSVYVGRHTNSGKKVALKQERPPNYWEFYISLEVHSRLTSEQMMSAYAHIDYALVGNNSSVYVSDFSEYGSLIGVCNKVKNVTNKNLDEYVVMHMSCQLLDIVDHLHAMDIIHADIKPDNFLLMRPLCSNPNEVSLQLIDFGVAIDTRLFHPNQTFNYVHHDELFKCVEMRTQRPWTYQLDLFGLAGVMHVLLLGRYMEVVQRNPSGVWMPKSALPRYVQRHVWETIFRTLLNVRDCRTMPNLQELKTLLKSELLEKEKYVKEAITLFNNILQT
ncbi:hypothetical protein KR026_001316 [Drosophila bipectinata]|nr:hypothetical protein KR026_001316 [Drosophila bipectinata]